VNANKSNLSKSIGNRNIAPDTPNTLKHVQKVPQTKRDKQVPNLPHNSEINVSMPVSSQVLPEFASKKTVYNSVMPTAPISDVQCDSKTVDNSVVPTAPISDVQCDSKTVDNSVVPTAPISDVQCDSKTIDFSHLSVNEKKKV